MSLEQDVERGRLAQAVLDNRVYAESYALIEQGLIRLWRDSREPPEREQAHQLLMMLDKVRNVMETTMRTGQVAQDAIIQKQTLAQRVGARLRAA